MESTRDSTVTRTLNIVNGIRKKLAALIREALDETMNKNMSIFVTKTIGIRVLTMETVVVNKNTKTIVGNRRSEIFGTELGSKLSRTCHYIKK